MTLLGLPTGTVDSAILSTLQQQMAEWHPDKQKFTDDDSKAKPLNVLKL